ncbi:hypothetical protein ACW5XF_01750 [Aeromonas lusitana]|uniref:Uncharacterized protein n=1 Tax=Aeromonas lusitana TaxID=931529 RepID=A0A2M8H4F3_9GAMM|nr:hypothetical protein [Aeromonas lusitana]PJC91391.1 hypothetical protein CUC44_20230 [Aeromonas lusitana]
MKIMYMLNRFFGRKKETSPPDMKDVFRGAGCFKVPESVYNGYPAPLPSVPPLAAYFIRFLVSENGLDMFFHVLVKLGYKMELDLNTQILTRSGERGSKKVMLFLHPSFAGMLISLASDDFDVIATLQQKKFEPPLPSESFPSIDPGGLGSLQGDMEYWWVNLWFPFWQALSLERQSALDLDPEWREFILMHQQYEPEIPPG